MKMLEVFLIALAILCAIPFAGAIMFLAIFLPLTLRGHALLPAFAPTSIDGVTTIRDAVEACHRFRGTELERAAYARSLTARKMEYSRRNPWDSPERCFERGFGYCVQQALALELILAGIGVECWPVQALRCRFPAGRVHGRQLPERGSGHMWIRLRAEGRILDIDPARADLEPGLLGFQVHSRVTRPSRAFIAVMHVFSAAENARRDLPALLGQRRGS
jgi:hypothetical protein